ncbi:membrane protein [Lacrimispora amygdalina]|uniref:Membrane protein n=1 Tax=Lacrimispora amygdalina TaxID=253257 RepID=A0ABQ5M6X3_9FIRM|nr:YoaK family protein [uncultured Clostridium sp.]
MIWKRIEGQMSEAMSTGVILTLSGGLQDAYTYFYRGKVYANAQTGNIIIFAHSIMNRSWQTAFRYLMPILAFAAGIYVSEIIRGRYKDNERIHWRQIVVVMEMVLLFAVGFLPRSFDLAANAMVSFVCAMQVEAFRKMKGSAFASTMCIGNLRSATEMLYRYRQTRDRESLEKCLRYYGVILFFAVGAAAGSFLVPLFAEKTIWFSCMFLALAFGIMFVKENQEAVEKD